MNIYVYIVCNTKSPANPVVYADNNMNRALHRFNDEVAKHEENAYDLTIERMMEKTITEKGNQLIVLARAYSTFDWQITLTRYNLWKPPTDSKS